MTCCPSHSFPHRWTPPSALCCLMVTNDALLSPKCAVSPQHALRGSSSAVFCTAARHRHLLSRSRSRGLSSPIPWVTYSSACQPAESQDPHFSFLSWSGDPNLFHSTQNVFCNNKNASTLSVMSNEYIIEIIELSCLSCNVLLSHINYNHIFSHQSKKKTTKNIHTTETALKLCCLFVFFYSYRTHRFVLTWPKNKPDCLIWTKWICFKQSPFTLNLGIKNGPGMHIFTFSSSALRSPQVPPTCLTLRSCSGPHSRSTVLRWADCVPSFAPHHSAYTTATSTSQAWEENSEYLSSPPPPTPMLFSILNPTPFGVFLTCAVGSK